MPRDPFARFRASPSKLIGTFWYESSEYSGSRFASTFHRLYHLVAIVGKSGVLVEQGLTRTELVAMPFRVPVTQLLGEHCKYRFLGNIRRYSVGTFVVERLTSIPQVWCIEELLPQGPILRQLYEAPGIPGDRSFDPTELHTFNWDGFVFGWRVANVEERRVAEEAEEAREVERAAALRQSNEEARAAQESFLAEVLGSVRQPMTVHGQMERIREASAGMAAAFAGVEPIRPMLNPTGSLAISPEPTPAPSAWERLGRDDD